MLQHLYTTESDSPILTRMCHRTLVLLYDFDHSPSTDQDHEDMAPRPQAPHVYDVIA